jgi:hypothetical protein
LAGPDVCSFDRDKNLSLIGCDRAHQDVVDDGTEDSTHDLDREGTSWAEFTILTKLEILNQEQCLRLSIGTEEDEVHVRYWLSGMEISANELD